MIDILVAPWRVGHHLGRTVYAMVNPEPSDDDIFIGIFDGMDAAAHVVEIHNRGLGLL